MHKCSLGGSGRIVAFIAFAISLSNPRKGTNVAIQSPTNSDDLVNPARPIIAPEHERAALVKVARELRTEPSSNQPDSRHLALVKTNGEQVQLPDSVVRVLRQAVEYLAEGDEIVISPAQHLLTTQEAADLLDVSRQYLVRLADAGEIPFTRTGTHRRIRLGDLIEYRVRRDATRREGLRRLTLASDCSQASQSVTIGANSA